MLIFLRFYQPYIFESSLGLLLWKMDADKLIAEVFVRTPLWDQKNIHHHNRFVLDKLWDEVAAILNTSRE